MCGASVSFFCLEFFGCHVVCFCSFLQPFSDATAFSADPCVTCSGRRMYDVGVGEEKNVYGEIASARKYSGKDVRLYVHSTKEEKTCR